MDSAEQGHLAQTDAASLAARRQRNAARMRERRAQLRAERDHQRPTEETPQRLAGKPALQQHIPLETSCTPIMIRPEYMSCRNKCRLAGQTT